jgi:hypothetical protein
MHLQQHLQLPEKESEERRKLEIMLEKQGHSLKRKFHDYKTARYDKEHEWERAIKQYEGEWDSDDLDKIEHVLSARGLKEQPITVNITRPKTNVAIARMKDIQFPTGGDFNFFLKPAPLTPEQKKAANMQQPDGQMQLQAAEMGVPQQQLPAPQQMVEEIVTENIERAPKMERKLRNRMIYAEYGRKARISIEDLCIKGTAVIKGPTIQNRKYKRYAPESTSEGEVVQVLNEEFVPEPSVERVDPLYWFPDPSARLPDEVEDCFELHPMSATELLELTKNPAFITPQIRKVLEQDPDGTDIPDIVVRTSREKSNNVNNRYWLREYHGPLDKEVLFDAGMISEEDKDDPLSRFTGEVWYCNRTVVRMSLSHIEGEDALPYGVATWEKDPNSLFGHGVPYLLRNAQRTVNNAYLMLLDNASLTSGPQIVLNREMIEPADKGDYGIEPMKVWFLTEYAADVREAMQFVNVPAQMEGIAQIIDTAMQFADVESSTPLMQQGEMPVGNNTTTGLAMVMSATNITQKAASMNWDDYITKPLIQRFYHYEMQYGEDPEVKGDFEIEVGGATERIEAQIRAQEIERMLGLASSNEEFMLHVDANKAFRALVDNTRTGDVLRSMQEVEQKTAEMQQAAQEQQQADPETLKAQAAMVMAQARQAEAQAKAQLDNAKQQIAAQELQVRYQSSIAEAQARNNQAALEYQARMAELASQREISLAQLQKDLQLKDMESSMKLQLAEIDFAKLEREIEVKEEYGEGI